MRISSADLSRFRFEKDSLPSNNIRSSRGAPFRLVPLVLLWFVLSKPQRSDKNVVNLFLCRFEGDLQRFVAGRETLFCSFNLSIFNAILRIAELLRGVKLLATRGPFPVSRFFRSLADDLVDVTTEVTIYILSGYSHPLWRFIINPLSVWCEDKTRVRAWVSIHL